MPGRHEPATALEEANMAGCLTILILGANQGLLVAGLRAKLLLPGIMAINAAECAMSYRDYLQLGWLLINLRRESFVPRYIVPRISVFAAGGGAKAR